LINLVVRNHSDMAGARVALQAKYVGFDSKADSEGTSGSGARRPIRDVRNSVATGGKPDWAVEIDPSRSSRLHCSKYRNGGWVEHQQIGSNVIERASGLTDVFPNRRADEFLEAAA
jgi:hypothetical protein